MSEKKFKDLKCEITFNFTNKDKSKNQEVFSIKPSDFISEKEFYNISEKEKSIFMLNSLFKMAFEKI